MPTLRSSLAFVITLAALAICLIDSRPAYAQRAALRVADVPEAVGQPINVSKSLLLQEREAARSGAARDVGVIVRLADDSLASYRGGVAGLRATSPRALGAKRLDMGSTDSQRYLAYLDTRAQAFAARLSARVPNAKVTHQYRAGFNGMALRIPSSHISSVAALQGVAAVYEDTLLQPLTDTSPAFINAPALWNALGGQADAGEGVIVGVLDTGIWPEHPSLSDPDPGGKPYARPARPGPAPASSTPVPTRATRSPATTS